MVPSSKPTAAEALRRLQEGNRRFVEGESQHPNTDVARLRQAGREDQADHAFATVLSCSDSRVPIERIFDAGIMELFVIRVAGNVCHEAGLGTIEYGLTRVRTPLLVVLGHTQCGAVAATAQALDGKAGAVERNIPSLVESIAPAVRRVRREHPGLGAEELLSEAVVENVWQSVRDLFRESPATRALVRAGAVEVRGAVYDVGSGRIEWLSPEAVQALLDEAERDPTSETEATLDPGA